MTFRCSLFPRFFSNHHPKYLNFVTVSSSMPFTDSLSSVSAFIVLKYFVVLMFRQLSCSRQYSSSLFKACCRCFFVSNRRTVSFAYSMMLVFIPSMPFSDCWFFHSSWIIMPISADLLCSPASAAGCFYWPYRRPCWSRWSMHGLPYICFCTISSFLWV